MQDRYLGSFRKKKNDIITVIAESISVVIVWQQISSWYKIGQACELLYKVFPDCHFGSFYPQNLGPQKLRARVLSDAYMINPKLYIYLSINGFVFDVLLG